MPDPLNVRGLLKAMQRTTHYHVLEVNLGIANGLLNRDAEAQGHFARAIELAPGEAAVHFFYARWLHQKGQYEQAAGHLRTAIAANPDHLKARHLLMDAEAQLVNWTAVAEQAKGTLDRFPSDPLAPRFLSRAASAKSSRDGTS